MTTKLAGEATQFLPFNRGSEDGGAGNPLNPGGHRTAYLWEQVWQRDAWLDLLARFVHVDPSRRRDRPAEKRAKARIDLPALPSVGRRAQARGRRARARRRPQLPRPALRRLGQVELDRLARAPALDPPRRR